MSSPDSTNSQKHIQSPGVLVDPFVSEHFRRSEFACRCGCGFDAADAELLDVLEYVRRCFGNVPITITSGCRCQDHNAKVGGAPDSQHTKGKAADIKVRYTPPDAVARLLEDKYKGRYGIGRYDGWTHIDVRQNEARWG